MTPLNHYQILGIESHASDAQIRKAFRQLAIQFHPDHNPDDSGAAELFRSINNAYATLSDPVKRKKYDLALRISGELFRSSNRYTGDNGDPADFSGATASRPRPKRGNNLELDIEVSFRDAALGAEKGISFQRNGSQEQFKIQIPAGTDNNERICIPGKGNHGENGGENGDLLLVVHILPDQQFTRKGLDLYIQHPISLTGALPGALVQVPTLSELKQIKLPEGVMADTRVRLKGCGIHRHDSDITGDLYVSFLIEFPEQSQSNDADITEDPMGLYSVLLVDDEAKTLLALQRIFRHEPYKIICTESGVEGLKLLEQNQNVSVIVTDQRMPVMCGTEFLANSRQLAPDAVRILLTSYTDAKTTIDAINQGGATHFISKPWDDTVLMQTVRDGVQKYHLLMENKRQQDIISQQHELLSTWNSNLKKRVLSQTSQLTQLLGNVNELNNRQRINFKGVIESLAALSELRTPKSRHHFANCAAISVGIARSLGLPESEIETIRVAALLHDIGKNAQMDSMGTMDEETLSSAELITYRNHPVLGQIAIDAIEDMRPVGVLIRHHHERYDGKGFPDGLAGNDIPIGAAIISIADRCDREMSFRTGQNAVAYALDNLEKLSGSAFSPQLFPHLSAPVHELYDHRFQHYSSLAHKTVKPEQLEPGMLLSRDLFSQSGLMLFQKWTELDLARIESLKRIFTLDPPAEEIQVAICTT